MQDRIYIAILLIVLAVLAIGDAALYHLIHGVVSQLTVAIGGAR